MTNHILECNAKDEVAVELNELFCFIEMNCPVATPEIVVLADYFFCPMSHKRVLSEFIALGK